MLLYPEGNYIHVSDERPFFQIGESKYGKFMLELAVHAKVDMDTAIKIALSSMISTAHANLSVGPPYDLGVYRNGSLEVVEARVEADSPYLAKLQDVWMAHFLDAIHQLPALTPTRGSPRGKQRSPTGPRSNARSRSMGSVGSSIHSDASPPVEPDLVGHAPGGVVLRGDETEHLTVVVSVRHGEQRARRLSGVAATPCFGSEPPAPLEPIDPVEDDGIGARVADDGARFAHDHRLLGVGDGVRREQHVVEAGVGGLDIVRAVGEDGERRHR